MKTEATTRPQTFLVICHEVGAWGKGRTLESAIMGMLAGMSQPSLTAHYDVRRFWWASPEDREASRRYDAAREAEGLPSWVEADGAPCVLVLGDGTVSRASLMASEDVIRGGRWDRKSCTIVRRDAPHR